MITPDTGSVEAPQMNTQRVATVVCALLFVPVHAAAGPVPAFSFTELVEDSSVIAVVRPTAGDRTYEVLSTLKGEIRKGGVLQFTEALPSVAQEGSAILVFARRSGTDQDRYVVTNEYGVLRVSGRPPPDAKDLASVVEAYVVAGLESKDSEVIADSVRWARHMRSASAMEKMAAIVGSRERPPVPIEAAYLEWNVPSGDADVHRRAAAFVRRVEGDPDCAKYLYWVAWSFARIRAPRNIEVLNDLMGRGDALSKGVVFGAVEWADKSSLPVLARLLGSSDKDVVHRAIVVISKITGRRGPGYREFMADPGRFTEEFRKFTADMMEKQQK